MSKGKFLILEWTVTILIIVFVVWMQFLALRAVYLKDKYVIENDLISSVRWRLKDWNYRASLKTDGRIRGHRFLDDGQKVLFNIEGSLYTFGLDTKKSMEDIYLRIDCDLNLSQPMTLQMLDSVLRLNSNDRFENLVIAFQRVDSTGKVLESFPQVGHLLQDMDKAVRIKLGFFSGESIDVFYLLTKEFWWRYVGVIVGLFLAGAFVIGGAIAYIFAYRRQREKRRYQIKWLGDDLHSLKTPVKQINGIMQWFELECPDVFESPEGAKKLNHMQACLNEILQGMDKSMVTCSILHKTSLKLEKINLELLLSDLIEQQEEANEGKKEVKIKLDYRLPDVVYSSPEAIVVIVRNLLDNAVKYSEGEARIIVRGYQERGKMVIEVADHGIGISANDQKKIFDEYYRVEGSGEKGSGRGLPYVSEVVKKMRGWIEVDSEPGKGSNFKIYIPIWKKNDGK